MGVYLVIVPPASRKNRHEYGSLYTFGASLRAPVDPAKIPLFSGFDDEEEERPLEPKRPLSFVITQADEAPPRLHP